MTNERSIELLNAVIDHISVAENSHETIRKLLNIGFTADELIDEFNWSLTDVREVEAGNCLCSNCQYLGDKYSFPVPNNLMDVDTKNPNIKHYYCCNGDCNQYNKDVTDKGITDCDCFEEL